MRKRGFTLLEMLVGMSIFFLLVGGLMSLWVTSFRFYNYTDTDIDLSQSNSMGMRKITEKLRSAMAIEIADDGKTLYYTLPRLSNVVDPTTGEREYMQPLTADTEHSFSVVEGQLIDDETGDVLVDEISAVDPDPGSTQYGQEYAPFQLTTIGSRRAVTINLITRRTVGPTDRYVRMKTTAILRNGS